MKSKTRKILGASLLIAGLFSFGEPLRELSIHNSEYQILEQDRDQILDHRYQERLKHREEIYAIESLTQDKIIKQMREDRDLQHRYLLARDYIQNIDQDSDLKRINIMERDLTKKYKPLIYNPYLSPLSMLLGMGCMIVGMGMLIKKKK